MIFKLRSHLTHLPPHSHGFLHSHDLSQTCLQLSPLSWLHLLWQLNCTSQSSRSISAFTLFVHLLQGFGQIPSKKILNDDATVVTGYALRAAFNGGSHSLLSLSESSFSAILCNCCISSRTSSSSSHGKFLGWQIYIFKDFKFQISNFRFRVLDF